MAENWQKFYLLLSDLQQFLLWKHCNWYIAMMTSAQWLCFLLQNMREAETKLPLGSCFLVAVKQKVLGLTRKGLFLK